MLCVLASAVASSLLAPQAGAGVIEGRAAYDKGDYPRALSEWEGAAKRGDADAELGLGKLYEFGLGGLAQSYKEADSWYRKAADQNNAEAQYRLALIWAVGDREVAADPPEAAKWFLLALGNKSSWSDRADELKTQFERFLGPAAMAEGEKRAAAWKQQHPPPGSTAPTPAAASAPRPPGVPGAKCAGWPFPTLPCTEDFPAFPGTEPQKVVVPPVPAQNAAPSPDTPSPSSGRGSIDQLNIALSRFECASLRAQLTDQDRPVVSGTVPDEAARARLTQTVSQYFPASQINVDLVPPPVCHALAAFDAMRLAGLFVEGPLRVRLAGGTAQLRQGDLIKVGVRGPPYAVNLRIDYFSLDGRVLHLWPNSDETEARLDAKADRVWGEPGHKVWAVGGAPFGAEFIGVVATTVPLDMGQARRPVEGADDYLRELKDALRRSRPPAATPNVAATLVVHTSGH